MNDLSVYLLKVLSRCKTLAHKNDYGNLAELQ